MQETITYQPIGLKIAVGIQANSPVALQERFNFFYNHMGTDEELIEVGPNYGYFFSTREKLKKSFINGAFHELLNTKESEYKKRKGGVMKDAETLGIQRFENVEKANVVPPSGHSYDFFKTCDF